MSSNGSPPSGVRSLRAKFEREASASSPTRGQSPVTNSSDGSGGSQPRSTVRASFIPVEPSKVDGQQRQATPEARSGSTAHKRRESFSMDDSTHPKAMAEYRETISSELERRRKSALIEPVPEVAVVTPAMERGEAELFPKMKKNVERPSGLSKEESAADDALESGASDKGATNDPTAEPVDRSVDGASDKQTDDPKPVDGLADASGTPVADQQTDPKSEDDESGRVPVDQGKAAKPEPRNASSSTKSKKVISANNATSSTQTKAHPSPSSATTSRKATAAERVGRTVSGSSSLKTTKAPAGSAASSSSVKNPKGHAATKDAVRTRPDSQTNKPDRRSIASVSSVKTTGRAKSPTRQVNVSKSITAPTASSVAKTSTSAAASPPASSRAPAGAAQTAQLRRQPSTRAGPKPVTKSKPTAAATGEGGALQQQAGRERAAKPQPERADHKPSGGGFLARMMRPTVSSASKVHGKPIHAPKSTADTEHATTGKTKHTDTHTEKPNGVEEPGRTMASSPAPAVEDTAPTDAVSADEKAAPPSDEIADRSEQEGPSKEEHDGAAAEVVQA